RTAAINCRGNLPLKFLLEKVGHQSMMPQRTIIGRDADGNPGPFEILDARDIVRVSRAVEQRHLLVRMCHGAIRATVNRTAKGLSTDRQEGGLADSTSDHQEPSRWRERKTIPQRPPDAHRFSGCP